MEPRLGREAQPTPSAAEPTHGRLERAAETFARAWADAARMRTAGLPVLPHQEQALAKAGADLDRLRPNGSQDLRVALTSRPELAGDTDRITATLNRLAAQPEAGAGSNWGAAGHGYGTRERAAPGPGRARRAHSGALDGAGADLTRTGTGKSARGRRREMKTLARELKRDPEAEAVLKSRAKELGIEAGSRLECVLEAKNERQAMRLERSLILGR